MNILHDLIAKLPELCTCQKVVLGVTSGAVLLGGTYWLFKGEIQAMTFYTLMSKDLQQRAHKQLFDSANWREHNQILELGTGPGANLCYYPAGTHLTAIDPLTQNKKYFDKTLADVNGKVILDEYIHDYAENVLKRLPSNTFDFVVETLVFCSTKDTDMVISEIHRVLKPGGRFLFLDHVKSPSPLRQLLQLCWWPVLHFCMDCSVLRQPHTKLVFPLRSGARFGRVHCSTGVIAAWRIEPYSEIVYGFAEKDTAEAE